MSLGISPVRLIPAGYGPMGMPDGLENELARRGGPLCPPWVGPGAPVRLIAPGAPQRPPLNTRLGRRTSSRSQSPPCGTAETRCWQVPPCCPSNFSRTLLAVYINRGWDESFARERMTRENPECTPVVPNAVVARSSARLVRNDEATVRSTGWAGTSGNSQECFAALAMTTVAPCLRCVGWSSGGQISGIQRSHQQSRRDTSGEKACRIVLSITVG